MKPLPGLYFLGKVNEIMEISKDEYSKEEFYGTPEYGEGAFPLLDIISYCVPEDYFPVITLNNPLTSPDITIMCDGEEIKVAKTLSELTLQIHTMAEMIEVMLESGNFSSAQKRSFSERMDSNRMIQKLSK